MRSSSAASIKRRVRRRSRGYVLKDYPEPSSKLGQLVAFLLEHKGVPCALVARVNMVYGATHKWRVPQVAQLVDFYGFDIRSCGEGKYLLAGEWFGRVYVDYVAEHLEQQEKQS